MRVLLGTSVVVASIACLDAFRGNHWDQFTMLAVLAGVGLVALVIESRRSTSVRLRPDLFRWVEEHAAQTDDETRRVVDRAVASYRAEMLPDAVTHTDGS